MWTGTATRRRRRLPSPSTRRYGRDELAEVARLCSSPSVPDSRGGRWCCGSGLPLSPGLLAQRLMDILLLFPGQGSQKPGMAKDLVEAFPAARTVFERIDNALGSK